MISKKGMSGNLIILMLLFIIIMLVFIYLDNSDDQKLEEFIKEYPKCEGIELYESDCCEDCIKIGFDYMKYDNIGFGSRECWCHNNGSVMQVW